MKKALLSTIILLVATAQIILAEDIIYFNNGTQQKGNVTEINSTEIKYKKSDNLDGPLYVVSRSEVQMIEYSNGYRDIITGNRYNDQSASAQQQYSQPQTNNNNNNNNGNTSQRPNTYVENNYYTNPAPRPQVYIQVPPPAPVWGWGWARPHCGAWGWGGGWNYCHRGYGRGRCW